MTENTSTFIERSAKAILAGAISFSGAVAVAYADGEASTAEWWTAVSAGLVALGGVYGIRNAD